jgi:hypothetical protein
MGALAKINTGQLGIIVGIITAIAWITVGGTVALVISIAAGGLIALRATMGDGEVDPQSDTLSD